NVGAHDALYTTYAAPLSRSEYLVDEGYFLNYFSPGEGVTYATDTSGSFALGWRLGKLAAFATKDFYKQPIIHRSYSDLIELESIDEELVPHQRATDGAAKAVGIKARHVINNSR